MGGDPPAPTPLESTREMLAAYQEAFPDILRITNEGAVPAAQAQLAANQATAGPLAELNALLYQTYGPQLAQTFNDINRQQATSQAQTDLEVLQGPGRQLIQQAQQVQRETDPEFYATRGLVASNLDRLLGSIDPSGALSAGETEALNRGVAQQNQARGLATNPSQTAALRSAMTFGDAAYRRGTDSRNQLSQALSVANQSLPAMQTGIDAFQVGTGRSSQPNQGLGQFTGVDTSLGAGAQNLGNSVLGATAGFANNQANINANRRDSLDRVNQSFSSILGSL